jgi:thiamine transport system substrate-binding protein
MLSHRSHLEGEMRKTHFAATTLLVAITTLAACSGEAADTPETLTLISHDSFAAGVTDVTFAAFTEDTGIEVEVIAAGDAGSLVNQAVLTRDNPLADVLFGVDDTFLSRAFDEAIFDPHQAAAIDQVDPGLVDPESRVTPIDYGDVCINYDKEALDGDLPGTLDELRSPEIASLLAVEHPATSSPGLAFMLATIAAYGEPQWLDFWADLRDGGVAVSSDWDTVYYSAFTRYGGDRPLVVSYASSPPAEVIFAEEPLSTAPTGVIEAGCYRQVEYAGVLAGTEFPDAAGQLVDHMLSVDFQEGIPLTWFVFPANQDARLPEEFVEHAVGPENPARLPAAKIADSRERWIDEWIAVMEG